MGQAKKTFVIPAGAGDYAPGALYCRTEQDVEGAPDCVVALDVLVESLPATGDIEIEMLTVGGDQSDDADWLSAGAPIEAVGKTSYTFAGWPGIRVRGQSGGTGGDSIVHIAWRSLPHG